MTGRRCPDAGDDTSTTAVWTLKHVDRGGHARGITVGRSQVHRILLADARCPEGRTAIDLYSHPPEDTTVVCVDGLGPLIPRAYPARLDRRRRPGQGKVTRT
jgi:hypothetical protein